MVLDLSTSMLEPIGIRAAQQRMGPIVEGSAVTPMPIPKTRLEAVKDAIKSFVARRRGDRLGLVVFSDNAYVVSPLSADHDYLIRYIDMVDAEILKGEGMTAVGEGLALANYLLARQTVAGDTRGRRAERARALDRNAARLRRTLPDGDRSRARRRRRCQNRQNRRF